MGMCYEWGTLSKSEGISSSHRIDGLLKLQLGNGFRVALNIRSEVYCWGTVKDGGRAIVSYPKPTNISGSNAIRDISTGYEHILAVDKKKEVSIFNCKIVDFL